jgi:hypothetical protein
MRMATARHKLSAAIACSGLSWLCASIGTYDDW